MKKLLLISIIISCVSCMQHHPKEDMIKGIIENPDEIQTILLNNSENVYTDSIMAGVDIQGLLKKYIQIFEDDYVIKNNGNRFFKKYYEEYTDSDGSIFSEIVIQSSEDTSNTLVFTFTMIKISGEWKLIAITP